MRYLPLKVLSCEVNILENIPVKEIFTGGNNKDIGTLPNAPVH